MRNVTSATCDLFINATFNQSTAYTYNNPGVAQDLYFQTDNQGSPKGSGEILQVVLLNRTLTTTEISDYYNGGAGTNCSKILNPVNPATSPDVVLINLTSEGGSGQLVNMTDKTCQNAGCILPYTSDTTPTFDIQTNSSGYCRIGAQNLSYTGLGSERNCSGGGTNSHTCTLRNTDELVYEDSFVYFGCTSLSGLENTTSGAVKLTIAGLEAAGDYSIGIGVQNSLLSGYTNYTSQQISARNFNGVQDSGRFDWVAKKGSKVWAFNYVTKGEQHVGMFNLTPTLYVLEMSNLTNFTITSFVETMVNATK